MKRIAKGYYKDQHQGQEFTVSHEPELDGELKWVIDFQDEKLQDEVFGDEDQIWYTKREASEMAKQFIETYS